MAYSKKCHKKLTKKAKDKHCCQLFPWIQSISNYLWWSAQSCKGDAQVLVEKWKSIVHHVSNVHEWDSDPKALFPKCVHQTLSPEEQHSKKWLKSGSVAHNALKKVVLQDTLLRDIKKLNGFHQTGSLEVFHSLLLKYCPKRQHFRHDGMRARIELAILDHNYNTQHQQATTKSGLFITIPCKIVLHVFYFLTGKARFKLLFPKGRKAWVAKPILESKKYIHLTYMLDDIVELRLHGDKLDTMTFDKPSTLPHNIATVDKPPKEQVIAAHTSRFPTKTHSI